MRFFGASFAVLLAALPASLVHANVFYGMNYGIDNNNCPTVESMKSDFTALKPYTNRVRTFALSVCNQAELALQATQALGMNLYLGMWIDRPDTFEKEMAALDNILAKYDMKQVDAIIVGSEVFYRKDTDVATFVDYLKKVKSKVAAKGVKVTMADTYYTIPDEVINEVDFVMMNAFSYWEGVNIDNATNTLMSHYQSLKGRTSKDVKISETGWPSGGPNFQAAVPSVENENKYLQQVLCRAQQQGIDVLWFSAIDEPYRGGVEAHFGVLGADRKLKQGITPKAQC